MPTIPNATSTEALELAALRCRILRAIEPVLMAVGVDAHEVGCDVGGDVAALVVVLHGPRALETVRQALGVRVIDAVRGSAQTLGSVAIEYRFGAGR